MSADDATTRPLKRARLSPRPDSSSSSLHDPSPAPSALSLTHLERHLEFWFDDGNIILIAQQTAFRIYRGLLAGQSTVFSDMFAASTSSPDETFDGCPVVHLSDSHVDLAHLLRVLLPTSPLCYPAANPEGTRSFDEVSAVVRLAHKYHIQPVQDRALRALQEYPLTSDFNALFSPPKPQISVDGAQFIGAANLARLTDRPPMLLMALYRCCYLGGALVDGWTRDDGTVEHLCAADLKRCMGARVALERERTFFLFSLLHREPRADCPRPAECGASLREVYENMLNVDLIAHVCGLRGRTDVSLLLLLRGRPAEALTPWDWGDVLQARTTEPQVALCGACEKALHEQSREKQKAIFDQLPSMFSITVEGWGEENLSENEKEA